jgi:peptidoglycan/xylan/chitin deacetylase (PgdA/CDA1 family)
MDGYYAKIDRALAALHLTGLDRILASRGRGVGCILTLHRVRPAQPADFAPNRILEIEPAFLDAALARLRALGYRFATLAEAVEALSGARPGAPLVALTADDGYRDTLDIALPVLERHGAPITVFVTPGFAERTARLWWVELERAVAALERVDVVVGGVRLSCPAATPAGKARAFADVYAALRAAPEDVLLRACADLCAAAGIDPLAIPQELCLDWDGIARLAAHPLVTIGAHTLTHPRLARLDPDAALSEIAGSRQAIAARFGLVPDHFAYPVGDASSAGAREFDLAGRAGFRAGVTTRPGVLMPGRVDLMALPRISLNGLFQKTARVETLVSGVPFLLAERLGLALGRAA